MSISLDQARWVSNLARLDLSESELAAMASELSAVLDYIDQLKAIPTEGVEPLAHPLPIQNIFRQDVPADSLSPDTATANSPARQADSATSGVFFLVPAVLE